jgi:hypothetical protein
MSDPAYIPQASESVLVALLERELGDAVRVFPSTTSELTDDIFAVVVTCKIEDLLSPDTDPSKATYRLRGDFDLHTLADRENEGEDAILGGIRKAVLSDDATGLPLDPFAAFWLIPSATNTDTTIDQDGRRVRRLTFWWGVELAS